MSKDRRELLAGYVDGELSEQERLLFEKELEHDPGLRAELEEFMKLKQMTSLVRYADLPEQVWENYWSSLYRKLERGVGWIFFSIGAIIILVLGAFQLLNDVFLNPEVPLLMKLGIGGVVIGLVILLVSIIRERLFAFNRDRYREVNR